jgi:hypothetical protein
VLCTYNKTVRTKGIFQFGTTEEFVGPHPTTTNTESLRSLSLLIFYLAPPVTIYFYNKDYFHTYLSWCRFVLDGAFRDQYRSLLNVEIFRNPRACLVCVENIAFKAYRDAFASYLRFFRNITTGQNTRIEKSKRIDTLRYPLLEGK